MRILVYFRTYNSYGGHPVLTPIGPFLAQSAPDFGDGVREVEVTLHFPHKGQPLRTLEELLVRYDAHRSTLPNVTYRRAKATMEINAASDFLSSPDLDRSRGLSLPLFARGVEEVIAALPIMKNRLKKADAFDLPAFLAHCAAARQRIPATEAALHDLAAEFAAAASARHAAMSPWEKLNIDWEDFHPSARALLDDPFFWDCTNDFSPNGNDTGADLLEDYRDWLKADRNGEPQRFLERLVRRWGYANLDEVDEETRDEGSIALAFAELKLRGKCDAAVRLMALETLARQREQAMAATDWPHREERLRSLDKIEQVLRSVGS